MSADTEWEAIRRYLREAAPDYRAKCLAALKPFEGEKVSDHVVEAVWRALRRLEGTGVQIGTGTLSVNGVEVASAASVDVSHSVNPYIDPLVKAALPAASGSSLDLLAATGDSTRRTGETDAQFRDRLLAISGPATVSQVRRELELALAETDKREQTNRIAALERSLPFGVTLEMAAHEAGINIRDLLERRREEQAAWEAKLKAEDAVRRAKEARAAALREVQARRKAEAAERHKTRIRASRSLDDLLTRDE